MRTPGPRLRARRRASATPTACSAARRCGPAATAPPARRSRAEFNVVEVDTGGVAPAPRPPRRVPRARPAGCAAPTSSTSSRERLRPLPAVEPWPLDVLASLPGAGRRRPAAVRAHRRRARRRRVRPRRRAGASCARTSGATTPSTRWSAACCSTAPSRRPTSRCTPAAGRASRSCRRRGPRASRAVGGRERPVGPRRRRRRARRHHAVRLRSRRRDEHLRLKVGESARSWRRSVVSPARIGRMRRPGVAGVVLTLLGASAAGCGDGERDNAYVAHSEAGLFLRLPPTGGLPGRGRQPGGEPPHRRRRPARGGVVFDGAGIRTAPTSRSRRPTIPVGFVEIQPTSAGHAASPPTPRCGRSSDQRSAEPSTRSRAPTSTSSSTRRSTSASTGATGSPARHRGRGRRHPGHAARRLRRRRRPRHVVRLLCSVECFDDNEDEIEAIARLLHPGGR